MKALAVLFALALVTTLYQTERARLSRDMSSAAEREASVVRWDMQYSIDEQRERLEDLEARAITRW
jgi:hypothetical protein